jgi:uncharacterized protein with HEPN domain
MADEVLSRACLKSLEIIGEASMNISEGLKNAHPIVEWRLMAGMRNKLVHHYFGVDWEIVDDVLKNELPDLRANILRVSSELKKKPISHVLRLLEAIEQPLTKLLLSLLLLLSLHPVLLEDAL